MHATVAVGDPAAHGRRVIALRVGQAAADAKAPALRRFHQQRAQAAGVFALAGQVAHHPGLGVVEGFQLEQIVAAPGAVERIAPVQHQAFAAAVHRVAQQHLQLGIGAQLALHHGLQHRVVGRLHGGLQRGQPLVEAAGVLRQVEHHEAHAAPGTVVRRLAGDGGLRMLEGAAPGPQLAVHRQRRPAGGEPGRRVDHLAAARDEPVAVPEAAHTVVLLAHPVISQRKARTPAPGQHECGRGGWRGYRRRSGLRQRTRGRCQAARTKPGQQQGAPPDAMVNGAVCACHAWARGRFDVKNPAQPTMSADSPAVWLKPPST